MLPRNLWQLQCKFWWWGRRGPFGHNEEERGASVQRITQPRITSSYYIRMRWTCFKEEFRKIFFTACVSEEFDCDCLKVVNVELYHGCQRYHFLLPVFCTAIYGIGNGAANNLGEKSSKCWRLEISTQEQRERNKQGSLSWRSLNLHLSREMGG